MLVLTIRTDKPEAEIGLYKNGERLAYETWHAHRELSVTLHQKIIDILSNQHKQLQELGGLVAFAGPGSFTGLRIGLSVANALAYALSIAAVGSTGESWIIDGIERLTKAQTDQIIIPEYGAAVHITQQKK